jgi:hypothetical protein
MLKWPPGAPAMAAIPGVPEKIWWAIEVLLAADSEKIGRNWLKPNLRWTSDRDCEGESSCHDH